MAGTEILIFFLVFIAIMLFVLAAYLYIGYRRERWELIRRIKQIGEETQSEEIPSFLRTIRNAWMNFITYLGKFVKPKGEGELSHLRKKFLKAGYRGENAPIIFYGIKAFLAILLALGFFLVKLFIQKTMASLPTMFFIILFALVGFYLPNLWIQIRISSRREKIQKGLPDALDLMVVCVESGLGLDAAINRVGEEIKLSNKVLSEEFKILNLELRAGKQRRDALRDLALRTDLEDLNSLTTILIQTEKFGTSIGQALRVHADSMRTKRYQRAEEIAQKMPVKLIFPLVLFIFPSLLIVILGPAAISIFRTMMPIFGGGGR